MNQASATSALVVGGGFSGMAAAIELRKRGVAVDLVEIDPSWRQYGAGISISGATLRAFRTLGILDRFLEEGYGCDGVDVLAADGKPLGHLPTPRLAGDDVPGSGAVLRPVLARILADATLAAGAEVRLGCTVRTMRQDEGGVDVSFTDGRNGRYDVLIAADGLYSKTRDAVLPHAARPRYSGQGTWRAVLPRPREITRTTLWIGADLKAGVNPVSDSQLYLFVNENRALNEQVAPERFVPLLQDLLARFTDPALRRLGDQLDAQSLVVFRPLEALLVPPPWYSGRVVLIGDAVHATTPHLASGACIGIEDAIVLAEELAHAATVGAAMDRFQARRWERCRMVVEQSGRLGEIEIHRGDRAEHGRIMRDAFQALAEPI